MADRDLERERQKRVNLRRRRKILRRRRRLLLIGVAGACLLVVLLILAAKGTFAKRAKETTLTVTESGRIEFEEVRTMEGEVSKQEVKDFAEEQIKAFNRQQGRRGAVRLRLCRVRGETFYLRTSYEDMATYAAFCGRDSFAGTVAEAKQAGYTFEKAFVEVRDGKKGGTVDASAVTADKDAMIVIVDQKFSVVLPRSPQYVSDASTTVDGATVTVGDEVQTVMIYQ